MATKQNPSDDLNVFIPADAPSIDTVSQDESLRLNEVAELAKFMEELVVVQVAKSHDINSPPYVHLNVNGTNQIIPRGNRPVAIKRKYLEVLARMQETRYTQEMIDGSEKRIVTTESVSLVYPFNVVMDKNPRGAAWLQGVLNEAN